MAIFMSFAQKDFFGIPTVSVADETYHLKWSAKMRNGRILEEFIQQDDDMSKFREKVVMELSTAGKSAEDEVANLMASLALMKEQSIVFSYTQLESATPGEIWVEYTQGNVQGGKPFVLEWNFCRYKTVDDRIVLFRFRRRFYDTKEDTFMKNVEKKREKWIEELVSYEIPALKDNNSK